MIHSMRREPPRHDWVLERVGKAFAAFLDILGPATSVPVAQFVATHRIFEEAWLPRAEAKS